MKRMTVRELIELLQNCDPDVRVVYTYDSIESEISSVNEEDEYSWLPDSKDKIGKSLQPTGRKIVVME